MRWLVPACASFPSVSGDELWGAMVHGRMKILHNGAVAVHGDACGRRFLPGGVAKALTVPPPRVSGEVRLAGLGDDGMMASLSS